jgi:ATP/maltotriose-dependent transcriptional regulator MalT
MAAGILRPRISELIEPRLGTSVSLLDAASGSGKTVALRERAKSKDTIYLAVSDRASFARFAADLVQAFGPYVPGMQQTLAGAFERALQTADAPATLALWLREHLDGSPCTVIIDDLHRAGDPRVARFIAEAIDRSPATCHWIIASESLDELPVAAWIARGITKRPIDDTDLAFTLDEAREAAHQLSPESGEDAIASLHAATRGVPADFLFALGVPAELLRSANAGDRFQGLAAKIFASFTHAEAQSLFRFVLVPQASAQLDALCLKAPYIFKRDRLALQTCFALHVRAQLATSPKRSEIVREAALALEAAGDIATALELLVSIDRTDEILAVVDRHGFAFLENHHAYVLHDAIAHLSDAAKNNSPAVLTLLAISSSLVDRFDVAEAYFEAALRVSRDQAQRRRVSFWYGCDQLRRGQPKAIELLQDGDDAEGSDVLRIARQSALAAALVIAGQNEAAADTMTRALREGEALGNEALLARVYHQASFVALRAGRYPEARELGSRSLELSERAGTYESAAGALSVLYNVAIDVDEDLGKAAELLRQIAECGAKCGSVEKQLYALAAAYEIEIERGDEVAAAKLEPQLRDFDIRHGARSTTDALLPARALQLAWHGEFGRARAILRASAELQLDPGRRALRLAEIAVYAAASGSRDEASSALVKAKRQMKLASQTNAQAWRARGYVALAFVLLGRAPAARMELASLADMPHGFGRLQKLVEFVRELAAWHDGASDGIELLTVLDRMREDGLGGFARMLEALPGDLLSPETGNPRKVRTA